MERHPIGVNTPAIVIWRQKHKNYSVFSFMTQKFGLIRCAVPHRRLVNIRSNGYLQPFSGVYITVTSYGEHYSLSQVDGKYAIAALESDIEAIAYAAVAGEMILQLAHLDERSPEIFMTVTRYSQMIQKKSVKLGTIILGWQLLALSGFVPLGQALYNHPDDHEEFWQDMAYDLGKPIRLEVRDAIAQVLLYDWTEDSKLNFTKSLWKILEETLYSYTVSRVEAPLQSLSFLRAL